MRCYIFPGDENHVSLTTGAALLASEPFNVHRVPLRFVCREETNGVVTLPGVFSRRSNLRSRNSGLATSGALSTVS